MHAVEAKTNKALAVLGFEPVVIQPGGETRLVCYPQRLFRGRLLYIVGTPGVLVDDVRVANHSVWVSAEPVPIEYFEERNPVTGYRGRPLDLPTCQLGNTVCIMVRNPTKVPALVSGCIEGEAVYY